MIRGEKQTKMCRPGIEPGTAALKATMLTVTPLMPAEHFDQTKMRQPGIAREYGRRQTKMRQLEFEPGSTA